MEEFSVDPDIRRAQTLPPEAFTHEDFLRRELDTLFRKHWLFVPQRFAPELRDDPRSLADWVSRKGSRAPISVLDRPLFLQRDWKGKLHGFPNVCTHAWHTLVQGPDRQRTVTCPQHGRQFDCEGRFVSQSGFEKAHGFPRESDHLLDLPIASWDPFFFLCLGRPAATFESVLGPVQASTANMSLDEFRRQPLNGEARELDGNWKQHAWNYMDRLHIPFIHKKPGGLTEAVDLATYRTELHPWCALQWAYARNPDHGFEPDRLPVRFESKGRRVFALWWFVFPNLTLNFYPWGLSVNVYMPVPDKPRRTLFLWYHYVLDDALYSKREETSMVRDTDLEDVDALSQACRGASSGFAPRGRFAPEEEIGPHWFHRLVSESC